ncbi:MAG TPA: AsmA family protein, partial [Chitinophagaceae bacterium]
MKSKLIRWSIRTAKIILITLVTLLLLMFLIPYLFPEAISGKIKTMVNKSIDGKIEFSETRLSFFRHFPSLTLSLHDFTSTGAAPFQDKQLLSAGEISFGIDLWKLIRGDMRVNKFYISDATINVMVNEKGEANYNVYKSSPSTETNNNADTTTSLHLEQVVIENTRLLYDDKSAGMLITARGLNYTGSGDLSKAIFDLTSHLTVDSFDLFLGDEPYILNKRINANLLTSINTNSLELKFKKNRLRINKLPLEITGNYEFLSRGYKMNFEITSPKAKLRDVFSVLPPSYQGWLSETLFKGSASITSTLTGLYIAGTDTMPDLAFNMNVRDGYIAHKKAPTPVSNLYLDFRSSLPALNMDSLSLNVDSVFFNVDKDYFSGVFKTKGYESMYVFSALQCEMNLQKLDAALGLKDYDLKGDLFAQLNADGVYATGQLPGRLRREIGIISIPSFHIKAGLRNGYLHYTPLPEAIRDISFDMEAKCPDHQYKNITVSIDSINMRALENYVKGYVRLKNAGEFSIDADLDAIVNLADIKKMYPLDSMVLDGNVLVKLKSSGNYRPDKNIFPKTDAHIEVTNASILTKYYPAPIGKIAVDAVVKNQMGSLKDLTVELQPVSFEFEGKPFMVRAMLNDFNDLHYDIVSKGIVDVGRIYRVFSQDGYDVQGIIETDLSLKGLQRHVTGGQYSKLDNRGTLTIKELKVTSELYPLPFLVKRGLFRFDRDHIRFDNLTTNYGKSDVVLSGSVSNIFNYVGGTGPLQGNVHIQSDH